MNGDSIDKVADFLMQGGTVACVTNDKESKLARMNFCDNICNKIGNYVPIPENKRKGLGNCILITEDKTWDEKKRFESFTSDTKLIVLSVIDQNIPSNTTKHITTALQYMKEIGLSVLVPMSSETWKKTEFEFTNNSSLKKNGVSDHRFESTIIKIHYFNYHNIQ